VTKKTAPGKKAAEKNIYSITQKGKKRLDEWLLKPLRSNYKVKDEFTLKFLFFDKLPSDRVLEYLQQQQKKTVMQKESFQRTLVAIRDELNFYMQAIIRKGIIHLEAENQWLEEVISALESR
jgi:PadR family transcriptional regulator AphA